MILNEQLMSTCPIADMAAGVCVGATQTAGVTFYKIMSLCSIFHVERRFEMLALLRQCCA
jgi:bifunctional ADP-heptose synthase (sugar kinase/adenylyltransferase)